MTRARPCSGTALRTVSTVLLSFALGACVTTTIEGNKPKPDKAAEIERRVDAANQYLENGNTEQAVSHLKRAIELDPNDPSIHMTLAQVFWRTGEYELADQHFRKALSIDGKLARARNNYAAFLFERGNIDGAIHELEIVVADTLYAKRADAFTNLGRAYLTKGRIADAEEVLDRAVKMDARQAQALLELADLNLGRNDAAHAASYYARHRSVSGRPTPRSLLLGIRIARATGERDAEASYAVQLKGLYPNSPEYREYQTTFAGAR